MLATMVVLLGVLGLAIAVAALWRTIRRHRQGTKTKLRASATGTRSKLRASATVRLDGNDAVFTVTVVNLGERSEFVDKIVVEGGNPWDPDSSWFLAHPDVGKTVTPRHRVVQEVRVPLSDTDPVFETSDPIVDVHAELSDGRIVYLSDADRADPIVHAHVELGDGRIVYLSDADRDGLVDRLSDLRDRSA